MYHKMVKYDTHKCHISPFYDTYICFERISLGAGLLLQVFFCNFIPTGFLCVAPSGGEL